ncbi:aldose 1-epimerase [Noviherbaspirillum aerium]|uniref:aldose 1-epimerase n=1 Tax=Noviherbaspirillum aerium TaxID=2588497 RepID=UPI00124C5DE7|nr:aldose 1-epimerase [Noviherbaspirillum aerium]
MKTDTLTLESDRQRLLLAPEFGGGVIGWDWKLNDQWSPMFRPWNGKSEDRYTLSCFPLVPWSNRITGGGFEHEGVFHPIRLNRTGESYPIHGDGWMQAWQVSERTGDRIKLSLESDKFDSNPYHYRSTQTFLLLPDGLQIDLTVTHLGQGTLPYGLGLHPYFMRNAQTRFMAKAEGVWLSGDDPIPVEHTTNFPETWDYNTPAPLEGPMIDNCFSGWNGKAVIEYPDRALTLTMVMPDCNGYSLMYRPLGFDYFCFEPITHPIDAFHMSNQPGLAILGHGDSLALRAKFLVSGSSTG